MANSENAIIEDYLNCRQQVLSELSSQELWNACNTDSEPIEVEPTELETIDYTNLSSERQTGRSIRDGNLAVEPKNLGANASPLRIRML
ncbi:MAG: hypothetical protein RID09_08900 [Coleofasciculus sp. G1-WW12-02]|uniref:hypothetical protein n=1 Tax=unclassified Coleofasciculus TaxID=2692782 RepID=UPI0032FD0ACF